MSGLAYNLARPDVVVLAVTSQLRPDSAYGEVLIGQWREAGLIKPSSIKPVFATLEQRLVIRRIGTLATGDREALRQAITGVIG